ncbi:uncharacterized protein LOC113789184 isoform X3 [Dermatophagoides pteronyssinus]|uniref:uncharacterized protein LOC113789184 isoform X3 n=1 Tax=Dermatophagoides pteronyssinus TaxID=6956 RepID=UPI003F670AE1
MNFFLFVLFLISLPLFAYISNKYNIFFCCTDFDDQDYDQESNRKKRKQQRRRQQQRQRRHKSIQWKKNYRKYRMDDNNSLDESLSSFDDTSLNQTKQRNNKRMKKQTTTRRNEHRSSSQVINDYNDYRNDVDKQTFLTHKLNSQNNNDNDFNVVVNDDKQTSFDEQQQPQQQQSIHSNDQFITKVSSDLQKQQQQQLNHFGNNSPTKNLKTTTEELCEYAYIVYNPRSNSIAMSRTLNNLIPPDTTIIYKVDETSNNEDKIRIKSRNGITSDEYCQNDGEHLNSLTSTTTTTNETEQKKLSVKDDEAIHVDDQTVFVYSTKAPQSLKNQWASTTTTTTTKATSNTKLIANDNQPSIVEETTKPYSFKKGSKKPRSLIRSLTTEDSEEDDISARQRNRHRALPRKLKSSKIDHRKRKSIHRRHHQSYIHKKRRKSKRETKRKR